MFLLFLFMYVCVKGTFEVEVLVSFIYYTGPRRPFIWMFPDTERSVSSSLLINLTDLKAID